MNGHSNNEYTTNERPIVLRLKRTRLKDRVGGLLILVGRGRSKDGLFEWFRRAEDSCLVDNGPRQSFAASRTPPV